VNSTSPARTAT